MYPNVEKVETSLGEISVYDLTVGYINGVETGEVEDSILNIAIDATNLTSEDLSNYRKGDLDIIASTAMRLTYPEAYNEDGTLKQINDGEFDEYDKKKS